MAGPVVKVTVDGLAPLMTRLAALRQTERSKILRKAVNACSGVVLNAAKALAPRNSGLLKRSLGRRIRTYRRTGRVVGVVGPRTNMKSAVTLKSGATRWANPTRYAHLAEFGRGPVRVKKARFLSDGRIVFGKAVGPAAAVPFLRAAWFTNRVRCADLMGKIVGTELMALARRGGRATP